MTDRLIIESIKGYSELKELIENSPKAIIIKLGADWCGPCKIIEPVVYEWFSKVPYTIQLCNINIDDNFELYGYFKKKKIVSGIPCILCFSNENEDGYPDDFISGTDVSKVNWFFERCIGNYS